MNRVRTLVSNSINYQQNEIEMNKTVTINISGIVFHIEEDAYEALSKYISTIKGFFKNTDGGSEIMADIEARIAELLQGKISASKQVIVMDDVNMVIETMGSPEQFASADDTGSAQNQSRNEFTPPYEKVKRRLFRDPDDKAIGGVCSGLAAYFEVDTVWVRLAMFLLVFFGGLSLWVYFILWIVMPEARTTADKFAMRGEPANINTIFKNFKEEAEDVKTRMNRYGSEYRDSGVGSTIRDNLASFFRTIFSIVGRMLGLFLVFIGAVLLLVYAASIMGISFADGDGDLMYWKSAIFETSSDYALALFAFVIVIGIPIVMLVYGGIKLLFKIRYNNRWLNIALGVLWSVGFAIGIYVTATTAKQFNEPARIKENISLHGLSDTIVLKLGNDLSGIDIMKFENGDDLEADFPKSRNRYYLGKTANGVSVMGTAGLNIVYTENDSIELVITKSSRGSDKREANANARAISYNYSQQGSTVLFDRCFIVDENVKFRKQDVNMILRVPKGKVVKLDKSIANLLDDVDNTTNTYDGDMVDRRWKMTEKGLECIDCKDLIDADEVRKHKSKDEDIVIDENGIRVSSDETEVKINEDGIHVHTPDKDVHVNKDGVKETKIKKEDNK